MGERNEGHPASWRRSLVAAASMVLAASLPAWGAPEAEAAGDPAAVALAAALEAARVHAKGEAPDAMPEADVLPCLRLLLERSRNCASDREAAAWLVRSEAGEPLGETACVLWPQPEAPGTARWSGPRPARVVAQVHTHPTRTPGNRSGGPRPSALDCRTARQLGVPVVVVTPSAVTLCTPERGDVRRLLGPGWVHQEAPVQQAAVR